MVFDSNQSIDTSVDDRVPYSTDIIVEIRDEQQRSYPIRALLDSGTSSTILLRKHIKNSSPSTCKNSKPTTWSTMGGEFITDSTYTVEFALPEFSTDKTITWVVHVDERTDPTVSKYDMIIGSDLLSELGIILDYSDAVITWEHVTVPMKNYGFFRDRTNLEKLYEINKIDGILQSAEHRQMVILDADYTRVDIPQYVHEIPHLTTNEKEQLIQVLNQYPELFQGGLGTCTVRPISLEVEEGAKPYHARPYVIPKIYEETTKKEINRLCTIGVLKRDYSTPWAAATFIRPKKTGDVRVLTDFRRLNMVLKRKPFPLPRIADILQKLEGFQYASALDLSMGYYHIPLDEHAQELCTTILPWGKYKYLRLPMGIKNATDIFQNVMMEILGDLSYVNVYLDDILVLTNGTYKDHLQKLQVILARLQTYGFRANLKKSFFATKELEYLGFWITQNGIQPQPKKVEAILRLLPPTNKRQLRHFLGMVNYYRDMWRRRSHILAPLTTLTSKNKTWLWGECEQKSFDEIKRVIMQDTMLAFPDFSKTFHIHTDSSDYQLGAVIMQNNKPLAFYSRKLNDAQKRYSTGEQELLSIVETLKEFKNILLGQSITVHTDHKNLLYEKTCSDRVIRWRLLIEEFAPTFQHIQGS